ncbi:MAG TPA: holo-ACP synthase [Acidimicrobiia bacterium]|nr:holo-ACP synthase [Acidimicrobiia bacterium]
MPGTDAPLGIRGLGTDLVEIERFRLALRRRVSLPDRLFTEGEQRYAYEHHDPVSRLAVRFGAKEAVMKALGAGLGAFAFRDVEVVRDDDSGAPSLALHGAAAARATARGVLAWHVSLTHTDTTAMAVVLALG